MLISMCDLLQRALHLSSQGSDLPSFMHLISPREESMSAVRTHVFLFVHFVIKLLYDCRIVKTTLVTLPFRLQSLKVLLVAMLKGCKQTNH